MNKNKSIRLKSWLNTKLQAIREEEGFTLIELIVVMAIIALLVLLAAPNFMGKIQEAKVTGIQNDVAVAEDKVSEKLIDHDWVENDFQHWPEIEEDGVSDSVYLESFRDGDGLYGKGGKLVSTKDLDASDPNITVDEIGNEDYKYIPKEFISEEINSNLGGTFITDGNGTVYYVDEDLLEDYDVDHSEGVGETNPDDDSGIDEDNTGGSVVDGVPIGYVVPASEDFKEEYDFMYGLTYYVYIGDEDYVYIPSEINGTSLNNYHKMFENTDVKGVANGSGAGIVATHNMFMNTTSDSIDLSNLSAPDARNTWNMFSNANVKVVNLEGFNLTMDNVGAPEHNSVVADFIYDSDKANFLGDTLHNSNVQTVHVKDQESADYIYISERSRTNDIDVLINGIIAPKPSGRFEEVWLGSTFVDYRALGDYAVFGYYVERTDGQEGPQFIEVTDDETIVQLIKDSFSNGIQPYEWRNWDESEHEYSDFWVEIERNGPGEEVSTHLGTYKWIGPRIKNEDNGSSGRNEIIWVWE